LAQVHNRVGLVDSRFLRLVAHYNHEENNAVSREERTSPIKSFGVRPDTVNT